MQVFRKWFIIMHEHLFQYLVPIQLHWHILYVNVSNHLILLLILLFISLLLNPDAMTLATPSVFLALWLLSAAPSITTTALFKSLVLSIFYQSLTSLFCVLFCCSFSSLILSWLSRFLFIFLLFHITSAFHTS